MNAPHSALAAFYLSDDPDEVLAAVQALTQAGEEHPSKGAVLKPELINSRTGKPERDGLYCARIFGPVDDFQCVCGKLASEQHAGERCDKCGVLCIRSSVRAERWGHIEPPLPLLHPVLAPRVARVLGSSVEQLRARLRMERWPTLDAAEPERLIDVLGPASQWLVTRVPVTPPLLRGTRRDPQDDGYARLINRANRLRRLIELNAPEIILVNEETMMLQAFEGAYAAVRAELLAHQEKRTPRAGDEEAEHLLWAVFQAPHDDAPRAAYAAHLESLDDPRGEFISTQLAGSKGGDLLRRNYERFIVPFGNAVVPESVVFRRGFLSSCRVVDAEVGTLIGNPEWSTVEHLQANTAELIAHPVMRSLRSIATSAETFAQLCEGPTLLPAITEAHLRLSRRTPQVLEAMAHARQLPALTRLTLLLSGKQAELDPSWLKEAPLIARLHRLVVQAPLEALSALALPAWLELLDAHPHLSDVLLDVGKQFLTFELSRQGAMFRVKIQTSRAFSERMAVTQESPLPGQMLAACRGIPHHRLALLHLKAHYWWGEDLAALSEDLRHEYGAVALVPSS